MADFYLEVYTWQGTSIGATHWYAEITAPDRKQRKVWYPLTEKRAIEINKRLHFLYADEVSERYMVQAGQMDYRFGTKEEAVEAATELFKQGANGDDRLIDFNDHTVIYVDWR